MSSTKPSKPSTGTAPERELEVVVDAAGNLAFVYDDDLHAILSEAFPNISTRRASHVEVGQDGKTWEADASPLLGQRTVVGASIRRQEALAQEVQWLRRHIAEVESFEQFDPKVNLALSEVQP